MTHVSTRLKQLVPGIYRSRDGLDSDKPLESLLAVLDGELAKLDAAITQLGDDHFAERASEEALLLIAELIGAKLLHDDLQTNRAVVARTLHWRRRKGTLRTIEEVLSLTSGWTAELDEAFRSLMHHQDLANLVPWRGRNAVVWDPIALADPLARRAVEAERPRGLDSARTVTLEQLPDESIEETLLRLGAADAGKFAASPRSLDLMGWARPEVAVVRTARFEPVEIDDRPVPDTLTVDHIDGTHSFVGGHLEPMRRFQPMAWRQPLESAAAMGALTERHEPAPDSPPLRYADALLTPTALAADGDLAEEAGAFTLRIDGVVAVGPDLEGAAALPLAFEPVGPTPALRFSDTSRPSSDGGWQLELLARSTSEEEVAAVALAERDVAGPVEVTEIGAVGAGSDFDVALALTRTQGDSEHLRQAGGTWLSAPLAAPAGTPLTRVVVLDAAGTPVCARLMLNDAGDWFVDTWRLGDSAWTRVALDLGALAVRPDGDAQVQGPFLGAAGDADTLYLVAPVAEQDVLGSWAISGAAGGAPVIALIGLAGIPPSTRVLPSCTVHGARLYVQGGQDETGPTWGLWSVPIGGGGWLQRRVRNRQLRVGATLLSRGGRLYLVGGATERGVLEQTAVSCDPTAVRPSWEELPGMGLDAGPGVLAARATASGLEAIVWADRTAPTLCRWELDALEWVLGPAEPGAPNPPAWGESAFIADELVILGAPPLPPSEVVFTVGGAGYLAFLPALDLPVGTRAVFAVQADGSSQRSYEPGEVAVDSMRLGSGRHEPIAYRVAPEARIGAPRRLSWRRLRLRQRSLGPWDSPIALVLDDVVALDPRMGRALVRSEVGSGRWTVSFRAGRAARFGPGLMPPDRAPLDSWLEHDLPAPAVPPDLDVDRDGGPTQVTRWVDPTLVGLESGYVATLGEALQPSVATQVIGVLGSPILPPSSVAIGSGQVLGVHAAQGNGVPHLRASEGVSLVLRERLPEDLDPDAPGPSFWVAGISTAGAIELVVSAGELDLRWCRLGAPGELGIRVVGAGHQSEMMRHTLPPVDVRLTLYGCQISRLEVPPWVEVVAAGCTFDGGGRDQPALLAGGARVRLRHCTVRGRTRAGVLEASSSVFAGTVRTDRSDLGFLRYCVLPDAGTPPLLYRSHRHSVSFASVSPTVPNYLVLDTNNGATILEAGERRARPGAYGERDRQLRELHERTANHLPMGLVPFHVDRTAIDLFRMSRRTP